jgi:hypothetical protein
MTGEHPIFLFPVYHFKVGPETSILDIEWEDAATGAKRIGVYSSEEAAQAAIQRLRTKPGFHEWPGGFRMMRTRVDKANVEDLGFGHGFYTYDYDPDRKDC